MFKDKIRQVSTNSYKVLHSPFKKNLDKNKFILYICIQFLKYFSHNFTLLSSSIGRVPTGRD